MHDFNDIGIAQNSHESLPFRQRQGIQQITLIAITDLKQTRLWIKSADPDELGIKREKGTGLPFFAQSVQHGIIRDWKSLLMFCWDRYTVISQRITCLPLKAWLRVPPSIYSSSPPTGTP